jgi:Carboxypeptidase regulatory-like domain
MKHWTRITIYLLLLFGLGPAPALAQFSSGIEGTVHDTSGAVVVGAKVSMTDTRLGVTRTTTTDQGGYFRIDNIAASTYSVKIQMSGFETWSQNGLTLQVAEIRTVAPILTVGSVSTNVTISASEAAVDLTSPTTGDVIAQTTVQDTPLTGQNIYELAALTPGMTGSAVNSGDDYTNEYAINIDAAGLRQEENGYMIDGAFTNTPSRGGGTSISPNPEVVQSMDIRTNDFDAEKGRNGGADVEVFTNSGSNQFHGTVDYYFLNNSLSARTEFESSVPSFQRNEMGATMGGPILKNKLFWFGAIDVLRSSTTSAYQATVETQDFDTWATTNLPTNVATQVLTAAPPQHFPTTNLVTVSQLEASTPGYYAPPANLPATLNAVGTADISYSVPKNGYQWSFRIDDYIGNSDRLYVDAMRTYDTSGGYTARPALDDGEANSSDFVNINWTHTFSPRLLNSAVADLIRPYGSDLAAPSMDIPYINVTGLQGFSNWGPGNFTQSTYGWRDVMTATVKTHTLKFGFDMYNIRENDSQSGAFDRPTYNFNNLLDFIQDKSTSESATPVNLTTHLEAPYDRRYREFYSGYYLQDDWKVRPTFTLNAGVRFDEMANLFDILTPPLTNFSFGQGSNYNGQIANGVTGFTPSDHVLNHNVWYFTPRVGFSWDIRGNGKTALRGGIGMFSDQPPYLHITDITAGNLPNFYTPSISVYSGQPTPTFQLCSAPTGFTDACPIVSTSDVTLNSSGGVLVNGVLQLASLGGYSPQYKFTQIEEWTLSLQQQLRNNLIVELNYSASAAHHLPVYSQDINRFNDDLLRNNAAGGQLPPTLARLNSNFGPIEYATANGNSIGNYGTLTLTRPISHGLAVRGIYTYGKVLDVPLSDSGSLDSGGITEYNSQYNQTGPIYQNGDFAYQRGRADYDIHQQLSADGTWMVPSHYGNAFERNLLGGWQFGGVWVVQTGLPFTAYTSAPFSPVCGGNPGSDCYTSSGVWIPGSIITADSGGDYNADGSDVDVPNVPSFGRHLSGQGKGAYLKGLFPASAFPAPPLGQEGDLGRNTYNELGYNNVDFTFDKFFNSPWFFAEKVKIEAKGEVFNLFNRVNLTGMESDLSNGLFGHATNQLPARSLQVHLRASF